MDSFHRGTGPLAARKGPSSGQKRGALPKGVGMNIKQNRSTYPGTVTTAYYSLHIFLNKGSQHSLFLVINFNFHSHFFFTDNKKCDLLDVLNIFDAIKIMLQLIFRINSDFHHLQEDIFTFEMQDFYFQVWGGVSCWEEDSSSHPGTSFHLFSLLAILSQVPHIHFSSWIFSYVTSQKIQNHGFCIPNPVFSVSI